MERPREWLSRLAKYGQEHLLQHWDALTAAERESLLADIESIDLKEVALLYEALGRRGAPELPSDLGPPPAIRLHRESAAERKRAVEAGRRALAEGKVGMILVAGGQGTRLGFPHPKGLFPIGPLSRRTLFQVLVDRLLAVRRRHGVSIPLWILTSPATDAATRDYFRKHNYLGLPEEDVFFFCQGTMPAVDRVTGKILLAERHRVALSPNGHGGMLAALHESGGLERAGERGIEYFFYGQVDNPLLPVCDERMIGYHLEYSSELTSLAVAKRGPEERVGHFVERAGSVQIIEYSDFPEELASQIDGDGRLVYWAGSIAVHVMNRAFLQDAADEAESLPYHAAWKKTPFVDERGERVEPTEPNSVKFERFIFDLLPRAQQPLVVEVARDEAFAPVKNADGAASDTPSSARAAMVNLHRRWLQQAGAHVADVPVEIHPLWADGPEEVAARIERGMVVERPTYFHTHCEE